MGIEQFIKYKMQIFQFLLAFFLVAELLQAKGIKKYISLAPSFLNNLVIGLLNVGLMVLVSNNSLEKTIASQNGNYWFEELWMEFLVLTLILDLVTYWWHRWNHQFPFLWRFHSLHHLDESLNSTSAVRFHFVEILLAYALRLFVFQFLDVRLESYFLFEILYAACNLFAHSRIQLPFALERVLNLLLVSPRFHRLHHHPERVIHDNNYSTIFSFWDRIFRSHQKIQKEDSWEFGWKDKKEQKLWKLLTAPFYKNYL